MRQTWVAVACVALLAGCGSSTSGTDGERPTPTTPSTSTAPAPPDDPTLPTPAAGTVLVGTVTRDDDRCLTLIADGTGQAWLLTGATAGIETGTQVSVRGSPAPDLATRCQRGTPFVVEAVEPG